MVYSLEYEVWYLGRPVGADGEGNVRINYVGWLSSDDEWIPLLSDRFDFEAGGRRKWKPVYGAVGAFTRLDPTWKPTGAMLKSLPLPLAPLKTLGSNKAGLLLDAHTAAVTISSFKCKGQHSGFRQDTLAAATEHRLQETLNAHQGIRNAVAAHTSQEQMLARALTQGLAQQQQQHPYQQHHDEDVEAGGTSHAAPLELGHKGEVGQRAHTHPAGSRGSDSSCSLNMAHAADTARNEAWQHQACSHPAAVWQVPGIPLMEPVHGGDVQGHINLTTEAAEAAACAPHDGMAGDAGAELQDAADAEDAEEPSHAPPKSDGYSSGSLGSRRSRKAVNPVRIKVLDDSLVHQQQLQQQPVQLHPVTQMIDLLPSATRRQLPVRTSSDDTAPDAVNAAAPTSRRRGRPTVSSGGLPPRPALSGQLSTRMKLLAGKQGAAAGASRAPGGGTKSRHDKASVPKAHGNELDVASRCDLDDVPDEGMHQAEKQDMGMPYGKRRCYGVSSTVSAGSQDGQTGLAAEAPVHRDDLVGAGCEQEQELQSVARELRLMKQAVKMLPAHDQWLHSAKALVALQAARQQALQLQQHGLSKHSAFAALLMAVQSLAATAPEVWASAVAAVPELQPALDKASQATSAPESGGQVPEGVSAESMSQLQEVVGRHSTALTHMRPEMRNLREAEEASRGQAPAEEAELCVVPYQAHESGAAARGGGSSRAAAAPALEPASFEKLPDGVLMVVTPNMDQAAAELNPAVLQRVDPQPRRPTDTLQAMHSLRQQQQRDVQKQQQQQQGAAGLQQRTQIVVFDNVSSGISSAPKQVELPRVPPVLTEGLYLRSQPPLVNTLQPQLMQQQYVVTSPGVAKMPTFSLMPTAQGTQSNTSTAPLLLVSQPSGTPGTRQQPRDAQPQYVLCSAPGQQPTQWQITLL